MDVYPEPWYFVDVGILRRQIFIDDAHRSPMKPPGGFSCIYCTKAQIALKLGSAVGVIAVSASIGEV